MRIKLNAFKRAGRRLSMKVSVVAALMFVPLAVSAASPGSASAYYYWGCTTYGNISDFSCIAPPAMEINFIIAQDSDHAYADWTNTPLSNGYMEPKTDGRERDVCDGVYQYGGPGQTVPWECNWGQDVRTFPLHAGHGLLGNGQTYEGISQYEMIDWTE